MIEINQKAKSLNENENLWVFFYELNTCNSFALLTEIFINRSFEGEKLSDNITCNPYSKRKLDKVKCGLIQSDDTNDKKGNLVYLVNILPQSLIYFNLGSINEEDEKKYKKVLFLNILIKMKKIKRRNKECY